MILHIFSVLEWTNSNQVLRITWLNRKSTIFFDTYLVLLLLHDGYCLLNARRIHTLAWTIHEKQFKWVEQLFENRNVKRAYTFSRYVCICFGSINEESISSNLPFDSIPLNVQCGLFSSCYLCEVFICYHEEKENESRQKWDSWLSVLEKRFFMLV